METLVIVILIAVAAAVVFLWTRRRASPPPAGDGRTTPRSVTEPRRSVPPPEPQVLNRNMVLGRNRAFDPTQWDDTPDGSEDDGADDGPGEPVGDPSGEDLPQFLDRDYLERKQRGDAGPG